MDHAEVTSEIETVIQHNDELASERIIRCIVYLSEGSRRRLQEWLNYSIQDYRDPIFAAEYEGRISGETPRRIRDFKRPFGQNELL